MGRKELCLSVALPLLLMISERARAQCTFPSFESKNVVPSGSQSLTGNFSDGSTLTFECMVGHRPIYSRASKRVTCDKNQWTDLQLECTRKSCGSLPDFHNGHYEMEGILFGDKVTAVCDKGYILAGQMKDRWCRSDGWDGRDPECESVKCEEPPPIENGQLENEPFSSYNYLEAVSYTCNPGFNLIGISTLSCSEDGTFKPDPPKCFDGCPTPEVPNAVRTEGRSPPYKLNNFIGYKCVDGYTMEGQNHISCTENGWSPEVPRCIAPCSRPDFGGNAILTEEFRSRRSFPHRLTVTFECIRGHEPVDSSVSKSSTCEETKWTELLFTCKAVPDQGVSSGAKAGIVVVLLVIFAGAAVFFYRRFSNKKRQISENTEEPLSEESKRELSKSCERTNQPDANGSEYQFRPALVPPSYNANDSEYQSVPTSAPPSYGQSNRGTTDISNTIDSVLSQPLVTSVPSSYDQSNRGTIDISNTIDSEVFQSDQSPNE